MLIYSIQHIAWACILTLNTIVLQKIQNKECTLVLNSSISITNRIYSTLHVHQHEIQHTACTTRANAEQSVHSGATAKHQRNHQFVLRQIAEVHHTHTLACMHRKTNCSILHEERVHNHACTLGLNSVQYVHANTRYRIEHTLCTLALKRNIVCTLALNINHACSKYTILQKYTLGLRQNIVCMLVSTKYRGLHAR